MNDDTPATTAPPDEDGGEALREAQWEAALKNTPLPGTPPELLLMAQTVRSALEASVAVVEPTRQDIDRAWQLVLQKAQAQGLIAAETSPLRRWMSALRQPRFLVPALAFGLMASVGLTLWRSEQSAEWEPAGMKGDAIVLLTSDAGSTSPRIVGELQALGLQPELARTAEGTLVDVAWPAVPTAAQQQWLASRQLPTPTAGRLRLMLISSKP